MCEKIHDRIHVGKFCSYIDLSVHTSLKQIKHADVKGKKYIYLSSLTNSFRIRDIASQEAGGTLREHKIYLFFWVGDESEDVSFLSPTFSINTLSNLVLLPYLRHLFSLGCKSSLS